MVVLSISHLPLFQKKNWAGVPLRKMGLKFFWLSVLLSEIIFSNNNMIEQLHPLTIDLDLNSWCSCLWSSSSTRGGGMGWNSLKKSLNQRLGQKRTWVEAGVKSPISAHVSAHVYKCNILFGCDVKLYLFLGYPAYVTKLHNTNLNQQILY